MRADNKGLGAYVQLAVASGDASSARAAHSIEIWGRTLQQAHASSHLRRSDPKLPNSSRKRECSVPKSLGPGSQKSSATCWPYLARRKRWWGLDREKVPHLHFTDPVLASLL